MNSIPAPLKWRKDLKSFGNMIESKKARSWMENVQKNLCKAEPKDV